MIETTTKSKQQYINSWAIPEEKGLKISDNKVGSL